MNHATLLLYHLEFLFILFEGTFLDFLAIDFQSHVTLVINKNQFHHVSKAYSLTVHIIYQ